MTSDSGSSNGFIAEKKHACFPLRSQVPPAISPPSTIDLYKIQKDLV